MSDCSGSECIQRCSLLFILSASQIRYFVTALLTYFSKLNVFFLLTHISQVGRPSNAPQTAALEAELRAEVSTKPRVYIASVHPELTESDIQTVFEAFGKVNSCR